MKTRNNNDYVYSYSKKTLFHVNPLLKDIIEKYQNRGDLSLNKNLKQSVKEELMYQLEKFEYLQNNGYFDDFPFDERKGIRLNEEIVRSFFANLPNISFEVTDACNLSCKYCAYSEFYDFYEERKNQYLSFEVIKGVLDYYFKFLKRRIEKSTYNKRLVINFYGGEPLLNFGVIKETVGFIDKNKIELKIDFMMTTNGILLDKYIDFLVKNNFYLLVSIDGNEFNNSYRVFHSGEESFTKLFCNLKFIQKNYSEYFKSNVNFNCVLHNRNSHQEVTEFIKTEFNKFIQIAELNPNNITKSKEHAFNRIFKSGYESFYEMKCKSNELDIPAEYDLDLFHIAKNSRSLCQEYCYFDKNDLFFDRTNSYPTASCVPFFKTMFVTVNRKILFCERVPHNRILGYVNKNGSVRLNFKKIVDMQNTLYDRISKTCKNCYSVNTCSKCLLVDSVLEGCDEYRDYRSQRLYLEHFINYIEENPNHYTRAIMEITIS